MICKKCGKEFEGAFCPDCGTQAVEEVTTCPKCGQERMGDSKFCASCGFNFDEQPNNNNQGKSPSKAKSIFYKIYRFLIAGGMLFLGIVSLLCLTAPTLVEEFFGESNALCTGFAAIGNGSDVDVPSSVVNASIMLLVMSIVALAYGVVQLVFAIKKPYKLVKNYACWAIDGVISIILLALGAAVASATKSEELMEAKLGSGFAMCIVMGVFGILCLVGRIVFELKFFKLEDTGLTQEQITKTREKKARKKLTKKQIMGITIPVVAVVVLIAVIVPTVMWATNIFRVGKVDKINIGDSQEQVIKVLGEPYEKGDYRFEYYSDNYLKVKKQIDKLNDREFSIGGIELLAKSDDEFDFDEDDFDWDDGEDQETKLQEKLRQMTYKYICVEFDSDKKVSSVFFDAYRCDSKEYKKVVESYKLVTEEILRYVATDIIYSVKYTDKSFYKGVAVQNIVSFNSSINIEWKDKYNNEYSEQISAIYNSNIVYNSYLNDDRSVCFVLDKDGILSIMGNGAVTESINIGLNNQIVKEIYIGSGVTGVEGSHFNSLSYVEKISVDENNETFKVENNCLISVQDNALIRGFDNSIIPNYVESIGEDAFSGCSSMTSIDIPSGVTSIGESAFYGCRSLTSIEIPSSVTSIGTYAFYGSSSLTIYCEAESQPSGWGSNWNYGGRPVVWNCQEHGVTESGIKWGLTKDGIMTIAGYNGTSTQVEIPSTINGHSVTSIGNRAFYGCSSLTSVTFGDNSQLASIGDYAFYNCSSLTSIYIPSGVTSIGRSAFYGCSNLTSIEIPSSVTSIGSFAFEYCSNLTIYCEASSEPSGWVEPWNDGRPVVWNYKG